MLNNFMNVVTSVDTGGAPVLPKYHGMSIVSVNKVYHFYCLLYSWGGHFSPVRRASQSYLGLGGSTLTESSPRRVFQFCKESILVWNGGAIM